MRLVVRLIGSPLKLMNRRTGCLILVLLFALLFVFWGMTCRLTLVI